MTRTLILAVTLLGLAGAPTAAQTASPSSPAIEALPRDLEMELALSALPPHLREQATVYVLNPAKGFEVARPGTNGFHALVARTGDDTFRGTWPLTRFREDILYPIGFDPAGARAQMRIFIDAAEMQAGGTPPRELKETMLRRLAAGYYEAPRRGGVAYMLAPIVRTYTNPDQGEDALTTNIPHVMYFAPNLSNQDVGGVFPSGEQVRYLAEHRHWPGSVYPFVILNGPHGYMVQFLGTTERAALTQGYSGMLARLCRIRAEWCLPAATTTHGEAR
jgi:hypothetical protein